MGLLDDHNQFHGAFSRWHYRRTPAARRRSANVWGVFSVVMAIVWLGGFFSVVAIASGALGIAEARSNATSPLLPALGLLLGVIGLIAGVVITLRAIGGDGTGPFVPWLG